VAFALPSRGYARIVGGAERLAVAVRPICAWTLPSSKVHCFEPVASCSSPRVGRRTYVRFTACRLDHMIGRQYPRSKEPLLRDFEGCSTLNAAADTGECQVTPYVHSRLGSRVETLSSSGAVARPRTRRAYSGGQRAACPVSAIPTVHRRLSDGHARERTVKQAPGFQAFSLATSVLLRDLVPIGL
jgi:hypothetical protein